MSKSFVSKRTYVGIAVMTDAINHVRPDVNRAAKQYGRESLESGERLLVPGSLYYVTEDYENAEPLLVRYVAIAKNKFGTDSMETFRGLWLLSDIYASLNRIIEVMEVGAEAKAISTKIDPSADDPVSEALFRRAVAEKDTNDLQGRQRALVMALTALSLSVTGGLHRSPWGQKMLERLGVFFKSYGIGDEEWEWVVKHAHLTRYDFVGLLSILLHHTGFAPARLEPVLRRRPRIIEVR
jgi:hypothetical protein